MCLRMSSWHGVTSVWTFKAAITIAIQLRQREWPSGHHDMLMKARIHTRRHFASEVGEMAIPMSTIEGCYLMFIRQHECHSYYCDVQYYVIICPDHCLLIGYDASRRDEKTNMFIFRHSRIEAESKWNRNFDNFVAVESKSNRNCNSRLRGLT